jgi:hypothetical protein
MHSVKTKDSSKNLLYVETGGVFRLAPYGRPPLGYIYWIPWDWVDYGGWGSGHWVGNRRPTYKYNQYCYVIAQTSSL